MTPYIKRTLLLLLFVAFSACWAKTGQEQAHIALKINGLSGKPFENVKTRLDIKKQKIYASQPDIVKWNYFRTIDKEVKAALQPYGYFNPTVRTHLNRNDKQWSIEITIKPGRRMKFSQVEVKVIGPGKTDPAFSRYLAHVPIASGKFFNSAHYEKTKNALQNIASSRGYFQARFVTNQLLIDLRNDTATATLIFDTGARSRIGSTQFSESPFSQVLLNRYLAYDSDALYNSYLLEKTRQNLSSSNFFQSVVVIPQPNQEKNQHTPVLITLYPQDQVTYTLGAGYGTDTKIRGLAAMNLRWLNSSGHSMKMLVRGSQRNSEAAINYVIPGSHPAEDSYTFNAGLMSLDQVTGKGRNAQVGFSYQTKVADWSLTASLTNLVERYTLINFPTPGAETSTNANVLYPQLTLQRIYAKPNLLNPEDGYNILLTGAGGSDSLGSRQSFLQGQLTSRFLYTIKATHTRVLVSASIGGISIKNLENLPLSMQFYAGGSQSIRGYEYNSVGPGRHVMVGSFELQQRVFGKFYVAGFIDGGNVSNHILQERVKVGAGPALVYLSPIGAIELSIAKNVSSIDLNTRKPNGGWRIHFSLGALI